ncbi:ferritin-like protein [Trametes sanguinea]|nr:ferritin-like protein [Trametes sanguinea]
MIEMVHSEMYSLLMNMYIKDEKERVRLFGTINTIPCVTHKANWALCWSSDQNAPFSHRLIAFAAYIKCRPSVETVTSIISDAVCIEQQFLTDVLPVALIGLNATLMKQYIEFIADHLLVSLGYEKHYLSTNSFGFIDMISMEGKTNFFEKRVPKYSRHTHTTLTGTEPSRIRYL